ncbi:MAG: hypothetical protein C4525_02775 [Desulfarculus sp.]|nr:MAG: hypothetical protein C4525_02775 [Desulfarculus sp.]
MGLAEVVRALKDFTATLEDPYKVTPVGMWACSRAEEVYDLLLKLRLEDCRHFADLGSGDGRVVLLAALFTQATGIEADPELCQAGDRLAAGLGLARARFICADCRQVDLRPYDLLFIYPDKPLDWLEARLPVDWPGRLLVYGPYFRPRSLRHEKTLYAGETLCGLWRR